MVFTIMYITALKNTPNTHYNNIYVNEMVNKFIKLKNIHLGKIPPPIFFLNICYNPKILAIGLAKYITKKPITPVSNASFHTRQVTFIY